MITIIATCLHSSKSMIVIIGFSYIHQKPMIIIIVSRLQSSEAMVVITASCFFIKINDSYIRYLNTDCSFSVYHN